MPWDDLIRVANKAEAKVKIQGSTHLDHWCFKGKRPLKISLNSRDNQTDKKASQAKASPVKQGSKAKKPSEKARKKKKKKGHLGRCKKPNPAGTGANAALAIATGGKGQKKKKAQNVFEVTDYSCNNKGHYAFNCTKPKN